MENVPGMARRGNSLFNEFIRTLENMGYRVNWDILQVADYGIPQNRRRLVLVAGKEFHINLPTPTHNRHGYNGLKPWKTLREAIGNMLEPLRLKEAIRQGGPKRFNWHVVRELSAQNLLRLAHTEPGKGRAQLPDELRPECHKNRDEGYHNVYGRMSWDQVSVTITGGCTTLSKGRFGHPEKDRTISVREAALLQTFPYDYCFDTSLMEYVCNIVGNALPCDFAEAVALECAKALIAHTV
jgi:DNA (cytosine-5)-methyltransferase 1